MSYELDRDPAREPSLAQMTAKAIDVLSKNDKGFFLMVEGGRIDHALHGTNAARALADTIAFDDAIRAALDKVKAFDPTLAETLIVVTADHDHTMAFNGYGRRGSDILGVNINYATGRPSTDANGNATARWSSATARTGPTCAPRSTRRWSHGGNKDYLQEVAIRRGGPGSETHGGGDVMLFAAGAGVAGKTFKGTIDNTKVFGLVKAAAGY